MNTLPTSRRRFLKSAAAAGLAGGLVTSSRGAEAGPVTLPDLPYGFDALEPAINARTMEIHHGKHHAGYVAKLNEALAGNAALAAKPLPALLAGLPAIADEATRTAVRNHGGGHWNHALFWQVMAPAARSGKPSADLAAALNAAFGSLDAFRARFSEAAAKRFGSGWAWLVVRDGKLLVTSTANQDNPLMEGIVPAAERGTPILGLDVWEHAYYLHYQNRRPDYIAAWWSVVNWDRVAQNLTKA